MGITNDSVVDQITTGLSDKLVTRIAFQKAATVFC